MPKGGLELIFQYFFTAGAGLGLGLALIVLPAIWIIKKINNGGKVSWRRK